MNKRDLKIDIHPLFRVLEENFMFFIASQNMMVIPLFQKILSEKHKDEMSEVTTSVKFRGFNTIKFNIPLALKKFNQTVGLKEVNDKVGGDIGRELVQQGIIMAIALFNILKASRYNKGINNSRLFIFAKHLRNGASHGNKFTFNTQEINKLKKRKIHWRGKVVKHTLQKKQVLGDFIYASDIFILMWDISKELFKIDREQLKLADLSGKHF